MKKSITRIMAALALLVTLAIPMGMRGQTRSEVVTYTLDGTITATGNAYATATELTQNDITWMVTANTEMSPWRIGGKNLEGVDRPVYSIDPIPGNITKIVVEHGTASSITVNSWTVFVASDANFANVVSTLTPTFTAGSSTTINRPAGADWTDCYYKFVYNVSVNGNTNRFVQFVKAEFYKQEGANPTCATPTFNPAAGTYTQAQSVSISCATEDATIYYTTNGQDPTTNSTVYSGAINVSTNTTIKAMATATGYDNSAVATAEYAFITLEHAGTLEDPYTVADARAAIDANAGTQGVYATGIVSAIPTAWNSQYSNITFDFVDNAGDTDVLEAYRCASGTGVDASQVAVGDVVVVYGNLTKYGSTYEFGQGCTLVSLTHPAITTPVVTVTPNTIDAPFAGADGTLELTYENITDFISFDYYFCDANGNELEDTDPDYPGDWIYAEINEPGEEENYTLSYIIDANDGEARTAYVKVYTFDDNLEEVYAIVTVNQEEYVAPTYAELPFSFNGGKAAIEETDGLYQGGLGDDYGATNTKLKFDSTDDWLLLQFNERPGTLTFDIKNNSFSGGTFKVQTSENGVTFTDLKTYTEISGTQNEEFTNLGENVRYIKWIYTEKVSGNVGLGNIALAEYTEPQQYTLTVEPFENLELITFVNEEMVMEGDGEIQVTNGNQIMLSIVANEGYVMETLMVNGVNHVNDIAEDYTYTFVMPAENVTISATAVEDVAPAPSNYVRITALDQLTDGSKVIIAARHNATVDSYYAMKNATSNKPEGTLFTSMTSGDDEVVASTITDDEDNYYWTVNVTENGYTFTNAAGTLIGYSSGTNFYTGGDNTEWTIERSTAGDGTMVPGYAGFVIKNNNTNTRAFAFNGTAFGAYATTNMNAGGYNFFLDFFVETEPVTETYPLDIIGYEAGSDGGYYLIASPVTVNPANVEGMTTGEYDLYSFDQAEADEWRNYKVNAFNLEPGKGYLYAKQATEPDEVFHFELTGTPYNGEPITLSKSENVDFPGWNLVGNPFGQTAYIDRDFYVMKSDGSEIIESETNEIAVMQGVFVIATNDGEELTFSTEAPTTTDGKIVMNVSNARRSVVDRATVRFGEGRTLPKFMLNDENTKIYFTEGNEEFAVVRSINENLTPVSFHAAENGTYTLSINTENVDFSFFHLIDNMTGNDIDLLSTPSYTFEASTTDYAQRFSLLYATLDGVGENNAGAFAFFNGNEWVVNNEGEANLQVIDMTGRLISSETVNGTATVSLNQSAGIYMLRLVNGNNVKVQKVVVR